MSWSWSEARQRLLISGDVVQNKGRFPISIVPNARPASWLAVVDRLAAAEDASQDHRPRSQPAGRRLP